MPGLRKTDPEMLRFFLATSHPMLSSAVLIACSTVLFYGDVSNTALLGWAILSFAWLGFRWYKRRQLAQSAYSETEIRNAARIVCVQLGGTGLLWGAFGACLYYPQDINHQLYVIMIVVGLSAGSIVAYCAYLPAVILYLCCSLGPMIGAILVHHGHSNGILFTLMILLFAAMLIVNAVRYHRWLRTGLRIQADNREMETQVKRLMAEQTVLARARSDFFANITHEFLTPLNAVIGFSDMMRREVLGPIGNKKYGEYISDIHASGSHLLQLINNVSDLSKIETRRLELTLAFCNLKNELDACLKEVAAQAEKNGIVVLHQIDDGISIKVDSVRFRQAIANLLSNSIKFSRRGNTVVLTTRQIEEHRVEIVVEDNGIGMDQSDVPLALQPFVKLKHKGLVNTSGHGLGLTLAKAFIELQGGSFTMQSEKDKGTKITIGLPSFSVLGG